MEPIQPGTRDYIDDPRVARDYDGYFARNRLFEYDRQWLAEVLTPPGRLLDLGCGTGRLMLAMGRLGHQCVGLDLSAHMLDEARRKLASHRVAGGLVRGDLLDVGRLFAPHSFDHAICMFSTLGMVAGAANRLTILEGVRRVLRPGGRLALHVHNRRHNAGAPEDLRLLLAGGWRALRGRGEWGDKVLGRYRGVRDLYIHVFSRREIAALCRRAGFDVRCIVPLNERRDGPLRWSVAASWRANGFLVLAVRGRP